MMVPRHAARSRARLFVATAGAVALTLGCHKRPPAGSPAPTASADSARVSPSRPRPVPRPEPPRLLAEPNAITTGAGVVAAMRDRYTSAWYRTVTFVQTTTVSLASGGELRQTWYEAAAFPGRLRIDTDLDAKSGVLFAGDSTFRFANGKLTRRDPGANDLLVLGFDVYAQPPEATEAVLRRSGFDLSAVHDTVWQGKPVYVVGAAAGDTSTKQFWIEKERLLFVRMLHQTQRGQIDVRFEDYVPAGRGWIAKRVEQFVNGRRTLLEEYNDIRTDVPLSEALFDPAQWATVPHWVR